MDYSQLLGTITTPKHTQTTVTNSSVETLAESAVAQPQKITDAQYITFLEECLAEESGFSKSLLKEAAIEFTLSLNEEAPDTEVATAVPAATKVKTAKTSVPTDMPAAKPAVEAPETKEVKTQLKESQVDTIARMM